MNRHLHHKNMQRQGFRHLGQVNTFPVTNAQLTYKLDQRTQRSQWSSQVCVLHCAIRNKNPKRNNICLMNNEETLDEGRFLEQKLGKHECRHQHISCGPDLTLDRNKNPGHCLQSQHFDEQLQSTVLYIDCRSTETKTQT